MLEVCIRYETVYTFHISLIFNLENMCMQCSCDVVSLYSYVLYHVMF